MFKQTVKLAGTSFGNTKRHVRTFGNADIGRFCLDREPDNPHDPNAIKVTVAGVVFLGYLPREVAKELAPLMDQGKKFMAYFVSRDENRAFGTLGLTVRIEECPCQEAA